MKHIIDFTFPEPGKKLTNEELASYKSQIIDLLKKRNAVILAHYYTDATVQALAEETGGFIGDSLEMAKFGKKCDSNTLLVAGVRFMGETSKILSPEKTVLLPDLKAECSLDLGCQADGFSEFCDCYPDRTVVVYANTSTAVKARADWVVTSSCAVDVVNYLASQGKKIIWAPDKNLGRYVLQQTGADMICWDASCVVHDNFKAAGVTELKKKYPDAAVLVHPEAPQAVIDLGDAVGSTTQLIKAAQKLPNKTFIVATEAGIFYKLSKLCPEKTFILAPSYGAGGTCQSCAHCPWMALNTLKSIAEALDPAKQRLHEVNLNSSLMDKARVSLTRLMEFNASNKK